MKQFKAKLASEVSSVSVTTQKIDPVYRDLANDINQCLKALGEKNILFVDDSLGGHPDVSVKIGTCTVRYTVSDDERFMSVTYEMMNNSLSFSYFDNYPKFTKQNIQKFEPQLSFFMKKDGFETLSSDNVYDPQEPD